MQKIIIALAFLTMQAQAGYFRMIDPAHPQFNTGVYSDFKGGSDAGGALALITHSTRDGCIIPNLCLDWTPLAIGGTLGQGLGGPSVGLGTSANLLPAVKAGALAVVNAITKDGQFANIKDALKPSIESGTDLKMAIGPSWNFVFYDKLKSKGVLVLFVGGAWHF